MEVMSDKSIPEFGPFGFTLALRVAQLLKSESGVGSVGRCLASMLALWWLAEGGCVGCW